MDPGDASTAATPGSGLGPAVDVGWEVAGDPAFTTLVRTGTVRTDAGRDHTVSVDVADLAPYTRYWYRFTALGVTSPVGRTQTASDDGALHALRLGFVSCSNWTGGYFSAYRHLAARDDLDFVLFLGDYIYEYGNTPNTAGPGQPANGDRYGPASLIGKRDHVPVKEILSLADYRQRHAQYKTDPDLQAAHAAFPWILIFDDHEVANNTYDGGAENHQPATEGDFYARRARAYQAYVEWMPIRLPDQAAPHKGTRFWRRFSFGPLADLSVIETRQNRSAEAASGAAVTELANPARVIMEPEQMAWLKGGIADPSRAWHLIASQVVFTRVSIQPSLPGLSQLSTLGLGVPIFNTDQWDGYQDDQREVTNAMATAPTDPVILTGDIHSSWANEIPLDPGTYRVANNSVGVEFVSPSITSDGFKEVLGNNATAATAATTGLQTDNPWIKYLDGIGHGFAVLDVTPARVQSDFFFVSDRVDPAATLTFASAWQSVRGSRRITQAAAPVGARSDSPGLVRAVALTPEPAALPTVPLTAIAPATSGQTLPATGAAVPASVGAAALLTAGAVGISAVRHGAQRDGWLIDDGVQRSGNRPANDRPRVENEERS